MEPTAAHFGSTAFFAKTWDDAISLVTEAKSCALNAVVRREASAAPAAANDIGPGGAAANDPGFTAAQLTDLTASCEMMRVTARLTQIMAWLLVQRAVENNEMTPLEAASADRRLDRQDVCLDDKGEQDETLPRRLRTLLAESRQLYVRVARLDELVARGAA